MCNKLCYYDKYKFEFNSNYVSISYDVKILVSQYIAILFTFEIIIYEVTIRDIFSHFS